MRQKHARIPVIFLFMTFSVMCLLTCDSSGNNTIDVKGKTKKELNVMLAEAVNKQDASAVSLLLGAGADANSNDDTNIPVIISAVSMGNQEIVRLLAGAGADINTREQFDGFTALSMAVYLNDMEMVQLISKLGGDPNIANKKTSHRCSWRLKTDNSK